MTRVYPRSHRVDVSAVIRADDHVYTGRSVVELAKARLLEDFPAEDKPQEGAKAEPWVLTFRETYGRPAKASAAQPAPPSPPPTEPETDD